MEVMKNLKDLALKTIGHGISGAIVAGGYAVTQQMQAGVTDPNLLMMGATLGAVIGFLRTVADVLEDWFVPKTTAGKVKSISPRRHYGL